VHEAPGPDHSTRIAQGKRLSIYHGFVPLIVVALVVVLFLGGTGGILVLAGIVIIAAVFTSQVQYRKSVSRRLYSSDPDDWMSRVSFYTGPFDPTGLPGAASFERQHSIYNNPPQVRLLVTNNGIVFGPSGHSGTPLSVPFNELESVDLIEGRRPRMIIVTPPIADRVGQVVLRTAQGNIARFSGLPIDGVRAALADRGATIGDAS
jgi:hypothetical protein